MNKDKILEDLEQLQQDNLEHEFAGSNERELWLRESIADYIVKNCSIQNVRQSGFSEIVSETITLCNVCQTENLHHDHINKKSCCACCGAC